jgi:hypothetical protein
MEEGMPLIRRQSIFVGMIVVIAFVSALLR